MDAAGRPFLAHLLDRAARPPVDRVLLLAGHGAPQVAAAVRAWRTPAPAEPDLDPADGAADGGFRDGVEIRIVVEAEPAGPVGALRQAVADLDEEFLLLLGDMLPPPSPDLSGVLAGQLHRTGAAAVMALAPAARSGDQGNVELDGSWIGRYDKAVPGPYIDRGARYLRRATLEAFPGDTDGPFFGALAAGRRLAPWFSDTPIVEVGTPDRWRRACAHLAGEQDAPEATAPADPVPASGEPERAGL